LRIQDGCDEHCTFCITTIARGANRSRPVDELVYEAKALARHHHEIVITGIHIGTYGADSNSSLGTLMQRLITDVPEVRFRLSSIEATELDDTLRTLFASDPRRLAPYLHAPLQSGSDRILKRMGRHWYNAESYTHGIRTLVGDRSIFGLSADVIAGFPGETEADHAATMALIDRLPFTSLHVFPFSLRPGTPAERLSDPVPHPIITRRAQELRAAAQAKAYRARRAGTPADIVAIGTSSQRQGVTEDYLTIPVDPTIPRGTRFSGIVPI
jgi:threonylcarbamoyladenosine tRNA methylthiotransferase MtaB